MAKLQIGNIDINKGVKGDNGTNGLSAYEIAVNGGFVGTESEWLASLVGADGADGADGTSVVVDPSKIAYLSVQLEDKRNSIDLVNKLIILYSFSSYINFSDDLGNSAVTSDYVLDYSAFTTGRWVILTYNRTKSQFEITDNVTGLQFPADNNYYVTSFYNSATTETVALPINRDAFVIRENNSQRHQPINWTALGDSHTDGAGDYPSVVVDWFQTSADFTDAFFNLTNLGVSGSTVYNNGGNSFYQRRTQIPATTDLLTIFGGHNDQGSAAPIGAIATPLFDDTTFIGSLQSIIEYAYGLNNEMRIILIIPHRAFTSGVQRDMSAYNQAIRDVGAYYALPVLDLSEEIGINIINRGAYLVDESPSELHLNTYGINVVGKRIFEFINNNY